MRRNRIPFAAALLFSFVLTATGSLHAQNSWPGFLGADARYGLSELPTEWSESEGLAWSVDIPGYGQSSPVVQDGHIYLTSVDGKMKEKNLIHCFDLTGKLKWSHESVSSIQVENNVYTSRAAPTPVVNERGVIAFFESGDIFALTPDKELLWERHLVEDYGKITGRFGLGGSLAQSNGKVFVLADHEGPSYVLALDAATGETIWKTDREPRVAWSSPMVLNVGGTEQVVVSSAGSVDGYDPKDGKQLWSLSDVGGNTVASPIPFDNSAKNGRFLVGASQGRNGENSEGARRSNMAVEVKPDAGGFKAEVLWRNEEASSSFGTPIVYDGRAYYVNRSGGLFCINSETGETLYKQRIKESNWATPLGAGGRVYFFGKGGVTTVISASDSYEEVAENTLYESAGGGGPGNFGGEIQYGVAVVDQKIYVRTGKKLYCIK